MEKKATSKYFTVPLLKTFLAILFLSTSIGLSFGQSGKAPSTLSRQSNKVQVTNLKDRSDVSAVNKSLNQTSGVAKKGYPFGKVPQQQSPSFQSPTLENATATFTGSLLAGDCTMPLRLFRDGIVSTCSSTRTFPGTAGGPSHFYDVYSVTNTTGAAVCITVTLNTTDLVNANIMAAAYNGTFDPANLATNWLGDPGLSTGTPQTAPLVFNVNVAAGAKVVIPVFSANASTTAAGTANNYTLAIDGIPSSCVAPDAPVVSGPATVCSGAATVLSVDCTSALNSAANWQWYSGSCGGTPVGSGKSITVNPTVTTTYYVRGEGGCLAAPGACGSITVNVSAASTAAVLSQVLLPPVPVTIFNEPFEAAIPPAGWVANNQSTPVGATVWTQGGALGVFPPHGGTGFASANFNNVATLGTISNWLICPAVTLRNGDVLKFWTRTTTGQFPDRLQVRMNSANNGTNVGSGATSVGDFTTLLLDINPTYTTTGYPTAWTQFTITLSGLPAGGTPGRLAFRYFVENAGLLGTNSDFIGIDDASYTSTIPGGPPTTCTGSSAALKVDITGGTGPFTVTITPTAPAGAPIVTTGYVSGTPILVTPAVTTTYALTSVLSSAGCAGTGNSGTPTVTVSATTTPPLIIVDDPTGPLCAGNPKLLTVVTTGAPSPVGTLYTQGGAVGLSPVSQNFETANDAFDNQAAEDFTVPANTTWNITQISAGGMYFNGAGPSTSYNVFIYRNSASNLPGTLVANYNNLTYTGGANPVLAIPSTALTAGTYWLSIQSNMSFAVGGEWAWGANGTTATGFPWAWQNPNGGFGTPCTSWGNGAASCIVGTDRNLIFTLTGTSVAAGGVPAGYTYIWSPAAGLSSTTSNPVAASPMTTTTYTVMGTAPSGCQTTASITITVNQLPAIVTQPSNTTVCAGQTATFTAVGSGAGFTYQWQVSTDGGVNWTNVTNGAPYSGATTGTLTINPTTFAMNGYRYRISVSGTCPPVANSNGAILTVNALPVVTITPNPTCGGVPGVNGTLLTASSPTGSNFIWSPTTGLFTNAAATIAYTGTATATVYAAPTTNTVYTVTATNGATGCVGTGTVTVNYTPAVPVVTPPAATICLTTPKTLQQLQITSALSGSTVTTYSSGTINLAVPDNVSTATTNTINAPLPTGSIVSKIVVTLNMSHTYPGDMIFNLKAPNGKILNLYKYNGGLATGASSGVPTWGWYNAQISSASTTAFSTVAAAPFIYQTPPTVFKADLLNADVTGAGFPFNNPNGYISDATSWNDVYSNPAGAWVLAMADGGPGDLGTLASWSIEFTYSAPTPGIWSVAGSSPAAYTGLYNDAAGTSAYTGTSQNIVYASPAVTTTYQVTVANGSCTSQPRTVVVTVNNPLVAVTQPTNQAVCTNGTTSFTFNITGSAFTHNWQVSTANGSPGSWVTLANGGVYSGVKTATLTITNPPLSMDTYTFRDSVSTSPCSPLISNYVNLKVNPLPTVTISAVPYTRLMPGMSTTLNSNSTPAAATYQWIRNGANVPGGTGPTLPVDIDGLGTYTLAVTDVNGCSNISNSVLISDSASGKVFIYPNPNSGTFQVRYYSTLNNSGLPRGLNIYDDKGARVFVQNYSINAPYGRMSVDMRKNASGTYWVEVVDANGNRLAMGRVIIVR